MKREIQRLCIFGKTFSWNFTSWVVLLICLFVFSCLFCFVVVVFLHVGNKGKARKIVIKTCKNLMKICEGLGRTKKNPTSSKKNWDLGAIYPYIIIMNTVQSTPALATWMPSHQKP